MPRKSLIAIIFIFAFGIAATEAADLPAGKAGLIGSAQCLTCHSEKEKGWQKNQHRRKNSGCEHCHGSGAIHQNTLDKKDIITPERINCNYCHKQKPHHFIAYKVYLNMLKLKCVNCHSIHGGKPRLLKFKKEGLCVNCHKDIY